MAKDFRNTLTITGPKGDRERLVAAHLKSGPRGEGASFMTLDFPSIVSIPEGLSDDGPSKTDAEGYDLYFGNRELSERAQKLLSLLLDKKADHSLEEFREIVKSEAPEIFERAQILQDNIRRFGVQSAWEWKISHWGCTEAFDTVVDPGEDEMTISFMTEDSPPFPLVLSLSALYPTLTFDLEYFDPEEMTEGRVRAAAGTLHEENP